jgi:hypothetical protein
MEEGVNTSNRSEISAIAIFLAELSNKDLFKKWLLGWA